MTIMVPRKVVLHHLLCKNLISRIMKTLDLLWKRSAEKSRFPISSSCTRDVNLVNDKGNSLLEPIRAKSFLPKHEFSTEDDDEPDFGDHYRELECFHRSSASSFPIT